jgi:hypothetical protein
MERLIVCQGTAQLVTALAALKQHKQKMGVDNLSRDHLLILGLSVPKEQTIEFARVVEKMASLLYPFATISRIEDDNLEYILRTHQYSSNHRFRQLFKAMSGVSQVDEVFVVRDWEPCNAMVLNAFPKATHICYGDSVGIYLPKNFMAKRPSGVVYLVSWARHLINRCGNLVVKPRLDFSYLLLPNAFGSPSDGKIICTKSIVLKELFILLTPLILGEKLDALCKQLLGRNVLILMSSNFSEQGVMSLESEISAYRDWIRRFADSDSVLLVKSHPRDSAFKRKMILDSLRDIFSEVIPVDSIGSAYLPVEVLMLHLKPLVKNLHALTVSTACLASYFVINSDTAVGFGNTLVEKYFYPAWRQERIKHEQQLQGLVSH